MCYYSLLLEKYIDGFVSGFTAQVITILAGFRKVTKNISWVHINLISKLFCACLCDSRERSQQSLGEMVRKMQQLRRRQ